MIAMAKRREDRGKEKLPKGECDLDSGYVCPVRKWGDLTSGNIRAVLFNSRYVQLLLSLTIIGFFLRFYELGFNSLWLDEASTYTFAVESFTQIWQATTGGEFNPPLFYWIEHVMLAFGNNEFILRFIPALLGVLTIPLMYCVGKEFMDRNVGIIAAAACAFSPFLIYYSQEARAYSVMFFFVAFALVFFLKALKSDTLKNWALFGVFSALAFWSHFYALVIIGALFLYAIAVKFGKIRENIRNLIPLVSAAAVFAVISLPLILLTIQLFAKRTAGGPTFGIQGLDVIYETFLQVSGSIDIVMFLLVILFIAGITQAFVIERNKGVLLVTLTGLTFIISYILSFRIPMVPRYLIFFSLVFFLGIAVSYRLFWALVNNKAIVYGFIVFFVIISLPVLSIYYSGYTKDDWRGFSKAMQQTAKPGDFVVLVPGYISQPFDYYYTNSTWRTLEFGANDAERLASIYSQKTNNTVYFIVTGDIYSANPSGDALSWLKTNTKPVGHTMGINLLVST